MCIRDPSRTIAIRYPVSPHAHQQSIHRCFQGLDDLKNGIIRTPLPPKQTFLDDPLRVIRCVRFASRFGFELVSELQESARDSEIQVRSGGSMPDLSDIAAFVESRQLYCKR
jgi:tRNA nucleotidyltransferase/poly(A) polymerase